MLNNAHLSGIENWTSARYAVITAYKWRRRQRITRILER